MDLTVYIKISDKEKQISINNRKFIIYYRKYYLQYFDYIK